MKKTVDLLDRKLEDLEQLEAAGVSIDQHVLSDAILIMRTALEKLKQGQALTVDVETLETESGNDKPIEGNG